MENKLLLFEEYVKSVKGSAFLSKKEIKKPKDSKSKDEIKSWLDSMEIENYTINTDLSVDVKGDVDIDNKNLKSIPVQFNKVSGGFYCYNNKLTSLEHCPKEVGGGFSCYNNKLTSLEHCPKEVGDDFSCSHNNLTSLEHCPSSFGGSFYCTDNKLTSLEHCPKEVGDDFYCYDNKTRFTKEDVKKVCKVGGDIEC